MFVFLEAVQKVTAAASFCNDFIKSMVSGAFQLLFSSMSKLNVFSGRSQLLHKFYWLTSVMLLILLVIMQLCKLFESVIFKIPVIIESGLMYLNLLWIHYSS